MFPRLVQANIHCDTSGPNGTWENIVTQWNLMEASVNFFAAGPHRTKDVTAMVECRRQDTQQNTSWSSANSMFYCLELSFTGS